MKRLRLASICFAFAASSFAADPVLFNGRDLTGWRPLNGKAPFRVVDGMIVGETVPDSPNTFLATEESYGDFILEFEVRMDAGRTFNSGVQLRSESRPDYKDGRVHGYQCEIDPSERGWSGGLYDEARRGWLYPVSLNPGSLRLFREGEWNHYRIEAIGPSLRTWVNGQPVAALLDEMTPRGFIALQVHSIASPNEAGRRVYFRNLRLQTEKLTPSPEIPGQPVRDTRRETSPSPTTLSPAPASSSP